MATSVDRRDFLKSLTAAFAAAALPAAAMTGAAARTPIFPFSTIELGKWYNLGIEVTDGKICCVLVRDSSLAKGMHAGLHNVVPESVLEKFRPFFSEAHKGSFKFSCDIRQVDEHHTEIYGERLEKAPQKSTPIGTSGHRLTGPGSAI